MGFSKILWRIRACAFVAANSFLGYTKYYLFVHQALSPSIRGPDISATLAYLSSFLQFDGAFLIGSWPEVFLILDRVRLNDHMWSCVFALKK